MIEVITKRCQPWLYKKAECRRCLDACPVKGCVHFEGGVVGVNRKDCIGCGICTTVCPTSALVMDSLSDRELLDRLQAHAETKESLHLGCYLYEKQRQDQKTSKSSSISNSEFKSQIQHSQSPITNHQSPILVNLPCLALLKESHLISLVLSGVKNIYLDVNRCSACSFQHGEKTIGKTISYARNLLNAIGYHDCIKTTGIPLTDVKADGKTKKSRLSLRKNKIEKVKTILPGPEYSRRELLHFLGEKAVEQAVERVVGGNRTMMKGGVGEENNISERRTLLFEALKKADAALKPGQMEDGMFPIHQLRIGENCTLCNICNLACPTGAIMKVEEGGRTERGGDVRIDFNMALCMGCHQCTELCPEGSLYKEKTMDIAPLISGEAMTLFKKVKKACPTCSSVFYPEDGVEQCSACRKKNKFDEMFEKTLYSPQTLH